MFKTERLESGKTYSLGELFGGGDCKLVIPDLQRDYCWGKDAWIESEGRRADLVTGFVESLLRWFENRPGNEQARTMGLVYAYEQPKGRYQICDGQQRLTTLFLLLGVVNVKAGGKFKDCLMSPEERMDDFKPRLLYAIRESTLAFLSDLTKETFIEGNTSLEEMLSVIPGKGGKITPRWYFREYDLDPSIQNMLAALGSILKIVSGKLANWEKEQWAAFGDFLLHDLRFLYYDMGCRSRGEETYIVINTTGEPLTAVENIKPLVLGGIADTDERRKYAEEWEAREQWFWRNRGGAKTSDELSRRFLVRYWQIGLLGAGGRNLRELFAASVPRNIAENGKEAVERWRRFREPANIQNYFEAFKELMEAVARDKTLREVFQSAAVGAKRFDGTLSDFLRGEERSEEWQLDMVLPAVAYLEKFPAATQLRRFVFRLRKNHFDNLRKRNALPDGKSGTYLDWRYIIQLIGMGGNEDGVFTFDTLGHQEEFRPLKDIPVRKWFGEPEENDLIMQTNGIDIYARGSHRALMGDLRPIVGRDASGGIDIETTEHRWKNLMALSDMVAGSEQCAPRCADLNNWYRLYRVLAGIVGIDHQPQTSWNFVGCPYATVWDCKQSDFSFLSTPAYSRLLDAADLLAELKKQCLEFLCKDGLLEVSDSTDAVGLLKAFLFAKTLVNEGVAIQSKPDSYPIGIDRDTVRNKRNAALPMEWGNLLCREIYKFGWRPTGHAGKVFLDTALDGEPPSGETAPTPPEKVRATTEAIKALIAKFVAEVAD